MRMKLPENVSSISIGEAGQLEEVEEGIVEVPFEHVEQAKRHGLTVHTEQPADSDNGNKDGGDKDYQTMTKKELAAKLTEKGIEVPTLATKAALIELLTESEKSPEE